MSEDLLPPEGLPSFLQPLMCLGEGGMGSVWSVKDLRNGKVGALKAIRSSLLEGQADRAAFRARVAYLCQA